MTAILSAVSSPDFLALSLLAALGILIFVLIRPKQYATEEEFWLSLIPPRSKAERAESVDGARQGNNLSVGGAKPRANGSVGFSGN